MVIYLDIVLVENLIINYFLIYITIKMMNFSISNKRMLFASMIGSIYSITMIFPTLKVLSFIPFQILVAALMVKISIYRCNLNNLMKGTTAFIVSSLILAGVCVKLSQISAKYDIFAHFFIGSISCTQLIIAFIIVYLIMSRVYAYFKDRASIKSFIYDVEITIGKEKFLLKGFLDTGNSLVEPVTKLPCLIVYDKYIADFEGSNKEYFIIPYSAIGCFGKLKGYKSDGIRLREKKGYWKEISALICPCNQRLSPCEEYNVLLSRGII